MKLKAVMVYLFAATTAGIAPPLRAELLVGGDAAAAAGTGDAIRSGLADGLLGVVLTAVTVFTGGTVDAACLSEMRAALHESLQTRVITPGPVGGKNAGKPGVPVVTRSRFWVEQFAPDSPEGNPPWVFPGRTLDFTLAPEPSR